MMNPIVKARKECGLSRKELALLSGASYSLIGAYEQGVVSEPTNKFLGCLRQAGLEVDGLAKRYQEWKEYQKEEVMA